MATILDSGKLQLSPKEVVSYRAAANRLHESCDMALDLKMPITTEEWLLLRVAAAALKGDLRDLDSMIARVRDEIRRRTKRH